MAKNPNQVWAEVGQRKFKVRPQLLNALQQLNDELLNLRPVWPGFPDLLVSERQAVG